MLIGWSNVVFAQPLFNYCVPSPVKENIFFEKLQIGTWSPNLMPSPNIASISASTFGDVDQNYEFSLQGMPQTRDTFYWQIWVDLNQDNDFEDENERLLKTYTSRKQKAIGKVHFPSTPQGRVLARLTLSRSKANNACGTQSKVLDYLDFWLEGTCPKVNPLDQVQVVDSTEESILLHFNWPKNTKFNWYIRTQEDRYYSGGGVSTGDSLLIKSLKFENTYQFLYQLHCGGTVWSDWSDPVDMQTRYKAICNRINSDQIKIDAVGFDHVVLNVPPQNNSERFEYAFNSYTGKGDTVLGFSPYGQSKIPLRLPEARYYFSIKKHCLDGSISDWTYYQQGFATLPDPCASVFLKINRSGSNSFAQAFPSQKIAYEWRLRLRGSNEWQVSESKKDTLSLSNLTNSNEYEIQVRVKCTPESWSEWSILQNFSLSNGCPKPKLEDIEYQQDGMVFKLSYQGTPYWKVIWDNPSSLQQCSPSKDSTKPELSLWVKYGEKLYVRIKGICKGTNEQSEYSDTLWLERPCVAPGLADFDAVNISDKTMDFLVNAEFCGDYDYMFSQDSLLPNEAWKSFSYRKYPRGNFVELKPGTKYFIKIRRQCYDKQAQSVYSPIKSFVTLEPRVCQAKAITTSDIKIEFAEPSTVVIRIKPQSANSHYRVYMSKYDEYVGYFYNAEFRDTVFRLNNLFQDGSYGFTVVAYCGQTEAWSEKIDFKPSLSDCPKLNSANIWVNDWNPVGDTIGLEYNNRRQNYMPYLWRYREAGTVNWFDTLVSPSTERPIIKLTFPKQNRSYEIQIKPITSAACKDNWSDSKIFFLKCHKPILVSRKVNGTIAEFESNKVNTIYRWRYRVVGDSTWKSISTGSDNKLTLRDLEPNSNYELQIQTQCDENEWSEYYATSFTTKPCFYDSLKISHDFVYPNQVRLKTNLPQVEILSGRPKFNWSMVSPFKGYALTPFKDTCKFVVSSGQTFRFALQFTCDELIPESFKIYDYQVQVLPCEVPSVGDIVVQEITSQSIKASVYRNRTLQVAQIGYRKVGTQNLTLIKLTSNSEIVTLSNLAPNTTYELVARTLCDAQVEGYSNWSPIKLVTTRKYGLVGDFLATIENNQPQLVQQLRLIPNPSQGQFNLELPKTVEGLAELSITNLNGQRIFNAQVQTSPGSTFPLDLSRQPQGVYLVHVRVGNQLYQEKLVLIK